MAQVRWTLTAVEDLRLLEEWIARDSPLNSVEFTDRLLAFVDSLELHPEVGRIVPEFNRSSIREMIFRGYRVVYSLESGTIHILRVVHGARDLRGMAGREPWSFE